MREEASVAVASPRVRMAAPTLNPLAADWSPFWKGTLTFALLYLFIGVIGGQVLRGAGRFTRGEASLCGLFVLMACVCMWMMWAMTWMSQVNPVLYPYVTKPLKEL